MGAYAYYVNKGTTANYVSFTAKDTQTCNSVPVVGNVAKSFGTQEAET